MTIRSAIAGLLEGVAASLRAADRPVTAMPSATSEAPAAKPVVKAKPVGKAKPSDIVLDYPVGFWLCTLSTFDEFLVGCAYPATRQNGGRCVRVNPYSGSTWAPYWEYGVGRFCYPEHKLDFVYLGPSLPAGQAVDARTLQDRIDERAARRAA